MARRGIKAKDLKKLKLTPEQSEEIRRALDEIGLTGEPVEPEKKSKYRNRKVEHDGIKFDSKKERDRWLVLKDMEASGQIIKLMRQVRFRINVSDSHVCDYVADFVYCKTDGPVLNQMVVEDVKSAYTRTLPVYRLKKKLMKAALGIDIVEI